MSYEDRLKDLGIWLLEERRNWADIIEVFKILKGFAAVGMYDLFDLSNVLSNRGHTLKLAKHRTNTDLRKYFFIERVIHRWNSLDQKRFDSASINQFKNNLKRLRSTRISYFMDQ